MIVQVDGLQLLVVVHFAILHFWLLAFFEDFFLPLVAYTAPDSIATAITLKNIFFILSVLIIKKNVLFNY